MSTKLIKDPIYGYIEIDADLVSRIIDTACFQRLRNIRQTSYAPLYPASFHNRFVHSIGVYFLGQRAFDSITSNVELPRDNIKRLFSLACLLHDVGHAPFSHTGEFFFVADGGSPPSIYNKLMLIVNDEDFTRDVEYYCSISEFAASHEIMSCIVALETFKDDFADSFERDFFSRCITGFKYRDVSTDGRDLLNCFIELLNSKLIDVDRLDYIIRDAHTTGYQSVSIDYERLLDGICIIDNKGHKSLGYHKSALSVIENTIYAHDSERKWIQNHPTILYEHFLLQHAMRSIGKLYFDESSISFFSYESLTKEGITFSNNRRVSLLADEDVLHIMKNYCSDILIDEYFQRNTRRHPMWKSESEYNALFYGNLSGEKLDEIENAFRDLEKYLIDHLSLPIVNDNVVSYLKTEEDRISEMKGEISEKDFNSLMSGLGKIKRWVSVLKTISDEFGIPFDYAIIGANKFKSGFLKQDLEKILINFPSLNKHIPIKEVSSVLSSDKTRDKFFYLYYRREDNSNREVPVGQIVNRLSKELFEN